MQEIALQTSVESTTSLPWGSASGEDHEGKSFDQNFAPHPANELIRQCATQRKQTLAELLFDARADAKIWTANVAMKLQQETRDRLFKQLDRLHDEEEWLEGDVPVSLESYKSLVRAIIAEAVEGKPGLSLAPNGNLVALWSGGKSRLVIEFQPGNAAKYIWRQTVDGDEERAAGVAKISRLSTFLAPLEREGWIDGS